MDDLVNKRRSGLGAYTPDPDAYPQDWPPVAYQTFAADTAHLPSIDWQPQHRRPSRAKHLARAIVFSGLGLFALSQLGGWLA